MKKIFSIILLFLLLVVSSSNATIVSMAGNKYVGLSSDTKPTTAVDGSVFYETDTLQQFIKVSGNWVGISASVSDTAYDASSWNGVVDVAPSKNAIRDKFESLSYSINGWVNPITDFHASGLPNTRGTATNGSNTITNVEDVSTWATGMSIIVQVGNWDYHPCAKMSISGSTITLLNANDTPCNMYYGDTHALIQHGARTTTGDITSGTNNLTNIGTDVTWVENQGINVYGAGAAGVNLICPYIHKVSASNFTLWNDLSHTSACNAGTSKTGTGIAHDDTKALQDAIASKKNIHIPNGTYVVTSELSPTTGTMIEGEGKRSTIILLNSTTANGFTITNPFTSVRYLMVSGDIDAPRTAGCGIQLGAAGRGVGLTNNVSVTSVDIANTYDGICEFESVYQAWIRDMWISTQGANGRRAVFINNPLPNGDVHWSDLELAGGAATGAASVYILAADTQNFNALKTNGGAPGLMIATNNTTVYNQRFVNCSFENGSTDGTIITLDTTASGGIYGVEFTGGQFGTGPLSKIMLIKGASTEYVNITGARFYTITGTGATAIDIDGANHVSIIGNALLNSITTHNNPTNITIIGNTGGTFPTAGYGLVKMGNTDEGGIIQMPSTDTNHQFYTTIKTGTQTGNLDFTLPITAGSDGQALKTNGSGVTSWATFLTDIMTTRGDLIYRNASNVTARLGVGTARQVLQTDGTDVSWGTPIDAIEYVIDGGGSVITSGSKGFLEVPYTATIKRWTMLCDASGSLTVDIKKSTYSGFPTTSTITASATPSVSSVQKNQDATLTGWTTAITAGDILEFVVTGSPATVTRCTISLKVEK